MIRCMGTIKPLATRGKKSREQELPYGKVPVAKTAKFAASNMDYGTVRNSRGCR